MLGKWEITEKTIQSNWRMCRKWFCYRLNNWEKKRRPLTLFPISRACRIFSLMPWCSNAKNNVFKTIHNVIPSSNSGSLTICKSKRSFISRFVFRPHCICYICNEFLFTLLNWKNTTNLGNKYMCINKKRKACCKMKYNVSCSLVSRWHSSSSVRLATDPISCKNFLFEVYTNAVYRICEIVKSLNERIQMRGCWIEYGQWIE